MRAQMEIEAKFIVPNATIYRQLVAMDQLAGYTLGPIIPKRVKDTFLDTQDGAIWIAGYMCRQRIADDEVLITLKKELDPVKGSVHHREEFEEVIPINTPPENWPEGEVRNLILDLIGDAALVPLFSQEQARLVRSVSRADSQIAEMSLDEVRVEAGSRVLSYLELEIELIDKRAQQDFEVVVNSIRSDWQLAPQPLSKFVRGKAFIEMDPV